MGPCDEYDSSVFGCNCLGGCIKGNNEVLMENFKREHPAFDVFTLFVSQRRKIKSYKKIMNQNII